ncbi:F-box domain-containing [Fusarium albosuccineum]|uniref:F-box domain-containing n=1 Tax=Fusarium albosuccineum TaxID=1237068 RepID=A0A8H4LIL1_9HYPO|nr:F-box domain-containing [Fusarium albosuccineum]
MKPVATSSDQLTSQTRHLSLSSPRCDDPSYSVPAEDGGTFSPATLAAAGAQPAVISAVPSLQQEIACPGSSPCLVAQPSGCDGDSGESFHRVLPGPPSFEDLPNEVLFHIMGFLDVDDLLSTSRTNHLLRDISRAPVLHHCRLRRVRSDLPSLLWSPSRPSLADLIARSIFMTHTSVVSRRLARSLVSIRLSRRLAARPSAASLVERSVLPRECVPGMAPVHVAPAIVAKKKAIEKERVKDGLRQWIASKWRCEVRQRQEGVMKWEASRGIGRVWRLRKFWERLQRSMRDGALLLEFVDMICKTVLQPLFALDSGWSWGLAPFSPF